MVEAHAAGGGVSVYKLGPFGPISNNAFILVDDASKDAAVIDAVTEHEQTLAAVAELGATVKMVLITHGHFDHLMGFAELRAAVDAPFYMHKADAKMATESPHSKETFDPKRIDVHLRGGETIPLGQTLIDVMHTPGHTPGSLCFYAEPFCLVGDTLFPGGPGHTTSNKNLRELIASITREIYALPDGTILFNGHGEDTTVGASHDEYRQFARRDHDGSLYGDVLWNQD